jgi:hypothetical protein
LTPPGAPEFREQPRQISENPHGAGDRFTHVVDSAIRTLARAYGIPDATIHTNLRTNIPDGGVDTRVTTPFIEEPSGRFTVPTVWQYKATQKAHLAIGELFEGQYLREKIAEGHGFRLAVADSLTAQAKDEMEAELTRRAREINPGSPAALVVSADDLASWVNGFPALVLSLFRPALMHGVLHLEAWGRNATQLTHEYVRVEAWTAMEDHLRQYVDFSVHPADPVLPIQGASGVGKTRLVYETLRTTPGSEGLVLYTNDPIPVARALANQGELHCILVADECPLETRMQLVDTIGGHRGRIRAIAINNEPIRPFAAAPEYRLERMDTDELEAVLAQNFPEVAAEHRRAYAALAKGFPRFAADLCLNDARIQAAGHAGVAMVTVRDYLATRFRDQGERDAVALVSMFTKLGFREGLEAELESACLLVGQELGAMQRNLRNLHETTGFIARAGRYYYVTPEIVADAAFEFAWYEWIADDPNAFLARIPAELQGPFLGRVSSLPNEEVRRVCGTYFREWADRLTPDILASRKAVERFITLIDTYPATYLPKLRHLIEASTHTQLRASEDTAGTGKWGPRRLLVWLCERFVQLPEHFYDAEAILFRLALAESEPDIANNATEIWKQLFRIMLSGTSIPFPDRLELLRTHLDRAHPENERELALETLLNVLNAFNSRVLGPGIVAGRIPPAEWNPKTYGEERQCHRAATELLLTLAADKTDSLNAQALALAVREIRSFLNRGYFDVVHQLAIVNTNRSNSAEFLAQIDLFLEHDITDSDESADKYITDIQALRKQLIGSDFRSLLTYQVGSSPWTTRKFDDHWKVELRFLAEYAVSEPAELLAELDWLLSPEAQSAAQFGEALGHVDKSATFLKDILDRTTRSDARAFASAYVFGLLQSHPKYSRRVAGWLDQNSIQAPEVTAELALTSPTLLDAVDRTVELFDRGLIGAGFLHGLRLFPRLTEAKPAKIEKVLTSLAQGASVGQPGAARVLLDTFYFLLLSADASPSQLLTRAAVQAAAWKVLEFGSPEEMRKSDEWKEIMKKMATYDADRVAVIAGKVLFSDNWSLRAEAKDVLADLARLHPESVMREIGRRALNEEQGWQFFVSDFKAIIRSLPIKVVQGWVKESGLPAARAIARHVPEPTIVGDQPTVPELTAWLLTEYSDDDRLFAEFCAGIHSFRMYWGDLATHLEGEAKMAERFLNHPVPRIREWAEAESISARERARRERMRAEEFDLP